MRLLVVSDSHGRYERLAELLDRQRGIDALIFLGDGIADLERADAYSRGFTVFAVRGNCDSFSMQIRESAPQELLINLEGYRFLLMHGHSRGVKYGLINALYAAREREADILLFGHTHECLEKYVGEQDENFCGKPMWIFNPGSLGASGDGYGYFGLIEIRPNGVLMSHGKI